MKDLPFYKDRIKKLFKNLDKNKTDAFLVSNPVNIKYLTGLEIDNCFLIFTKSKNYIITDSRFVFEVSKYSHIYEIIIAKRKLPDYLKDICKKHKIKKLAVESLHISFAFYLNIKDFLKDTVEITPCREIVESLRTIKDVSEIKKIKKTVSLLSKLCVYLTQVIKRGDLTEKEIAYLLEKKIKEEFNADYSFPPIIASGVRSSYPHAKLSSKKIQSASYVLTDIGLRKYGYCTDLTRLCVLSKMSFEQKKVLNLLIEHQQELIDLVKPGKRLSEIDAFSRKKLASFGYEDNLLHSVGHGVGLNVHEKPSVSFNSKDIAKSGMVITIEPGLYFNNKWGIRIEDMLLVTQKGNTVLTKNIPKILK